jgi:hypothetical protein
MQFGYRVECGIRILCDWLFPVFHFLLSNFSENLSVEKSPFFINFLKLIYGALGLYWRYFAPVPLLASEALSWDLFFWG